MLNVKSSQKQLMKSCASSKKILNFASFDLSGFRLVVIRLLAKAHTRRGLASSRAASMSAYTLSVAPPRLREICPPAAISFSTTRGGVFRYLFFFLFWVSCTTNAAQSARGNVPTAE